MAEKKRRKSAYVGKNVYICSRKRAAKENMRLLKTIIATGLFALMLASCGGAGDYSPKPQAYLRIDLPPHAYTVYDTAALPFTFEQSQLSEVVWKKGRKGEKWIDLRYPNYKGYVFLTYKELQGKRDLAGQVDTSLKFLENHYAYSTGVDEQQFVDREHRIYGTTYHLKGQNVASTYQFWATDSVRHFLRGSLYIDCTPNNDSLAPVLTYIQEDINHLIESIRWRP